MNRVSTTPRVSRSHGYMLAAFALAIAMVGAPLGNGATFALWRDFRFSNWGSITATLPRQLVDEPIISSTPKCYVLGTSNSFREGAAPFWLPPDNWYENTLHEVFLIDGEAAVVRVDMSNFPQTDNRNQGHYRIQIGTPEAPNTISTTYLPSGLQFVAAAAQGFTSIQKVYEFVVVPKGQSSIISDPGKDQNGVTRRIFETNDDGRLAIWAEVTRPTNQNGNFRNTAVTTMSIDIHVFEAGVTEPVSSHLFPLYFPGILVGSGHDNYMVRPTGVSTGLNPEPAVDSRCVVQGSDPGMGKTNPPIFDINRVPDLVGWEVEPAVAQLHDLGFQAKVVEVVPEIPELDVELDASARSFLDDLYADYRPGIVLEVSDVGKFLPLGSEVTLKVSGELPELILEEDELLIDEDELTTLEETDEVETGGIVDETEDGLGEESEGDGAGDVDGIVPEPEEGGEPEVVEGGDTDDGAKEATEETPEIPVVLPEITEEIEHVVAPEPEPEPETLEIVALPAVIEPELVVIEEPTEPAYPEPEPDPVSQEEEQYVVVVEEPVAVEESAEDEVPEEVFVDPGWDVEPQPEEE